MHLWRGEKYCMRLAAGLNDTAFNIIPYEKQLINGIDFPSGLQGKLQNYFEDSFE
jgi:hypothetical protein